MFKSYFRISVRHLLRDKLYTLLNMGSLAIGLTCFIWTWLYVQNELNYDQYPAQSQHIYRVVTDFETSTGTSYHATSAPLWAPYLQRDYPEVINAVRLKALPQKMMVNSNKQQFYETRWAFADPAFFQTFSLPLIQGKAEKVLNKKHQVVITQSVAKKYFGDGNPLGQTLTLANHQAFMVSGIMADMPAQSHFHFDFVASFSSTPQIFGDRFIKHKRNLWVHTYLQLAPDASPRQLEARLPGFIDTYTGSQKHNGFSLTTHLQPLTRIHSGSHREQEIEANGWQNTRNILLIIGSFILLTGTANYVNLATARATRRAKEVGIAKVLGAYRNQVMVQFLAESLILAFLGLLLACVCLEISLPVLNQLIGKSLNLSALFTPVFLAKVIALTIAIGLLAGSYPALVLAGFAPVKALKGNFIHSTKGGILRKGLIITQFTVSIVLIISTQVVYKQLYYMQHKSLGFNKEQVLLVEFPNENARKHYEIYKTAVLRNPAVSNISGTSEAPGISTNEHVFSPIGQHNTHNRVVHRSFVDYGYFNTLEISLVAGRTFSRKFPKDMLPEKQGSTIIINETAVKAFGWQSPREAIGKKLKRVELSKSNYTIVGVAKDFHTQSLHQVIQPTLFNYAPARRQSHLLIRYQTKNTRALLAQLQSQWQKLIPQCNFSYSFADQNFAVLYQSESRLGNLMAYFARLAVLVACLGIFGLSAYLAQQRQKEISIRKVLGASLPQLWYVFSQGFIGLVLVASLVAFPLTWFLSQNWLQGFAYQVSVSWGEFAIAGIATLGIALLTISFHALSTARANPTKILRNE